MINGTQFISALGAEGITLRLIFAALSYTTVDLLEFEEDQTVTSFFFAAIERAENIALQADVIASLSLDVLKGSTRAYEKGN